VGHSLGASFPQPHNHFFESLKKERSMAITTTSSLPAPVQQSFDYKLLSVPVSNMIHKIPAMRKQMPRNGGTTLRMRRYNPLNTAMVPLGNSGVTPPPQNLTAVDIDAKISFYGTYVQLNEQVTLQNQDPVLNECAARLGVSLDILGEVKPNLNTLENLTAIA
jgi:N4-gp56 family major capsid protein